MDNCKVRNKARALRYSVVRQQYRLGNLTKDEAIELLRGRLSPDDPDSVCDDSDALFVSDEVALLFVTQLFDDEG